VASNFFYKVPIKPKMPLGAIKQAASDFSQAAKDLVGTSQLSVTGLAAPGPSKAVSKTSLASDPPAEGTLPPQAPLGSQPTLLPLVRVVRTRLPPRELFGNHGVLGGHPGHPLDSEGQATSAASQEATPV
jgi:hypothetical protein